METSTLSTKRCTWPSSGRMVVDVCGTIRAFLSESTTWTLRPVITWLGVGCRIVTTAGDDGREPGVGVVEGLLAGGAHPPDKIATESNANSAAERTDIGRLVT